ncbi:SDR family oxidoreductase [Nocardioides marmoriginsengisoli]|uniref:SDR family oxidoreductase n=1 Tax=Nocardioides marmoriginsengisoli TaxID=661483 RepID=A0A3N0CCA7_9ACTN|nr:SDR family oxidoreductase [Nocardioides marmoriginsengisoli]RNL61085.1 SDR family oxidoreductase [Nocardioides marmoriginsengisoli]
MPHAVVTGAASGMGRLMVERLLERGWTVSAVDLDTPALHELAGTAGVSAYPCDVSDPQLVRAAAAAVLAAHPRIDRLVTAAGIAVIGRLDDLDPERVARPMQVNYLGTVAWVHALLPALRESGGELVLFASLAGWIVTPGYGAYTASKFALVGYAETLALELRGSGITVRAVCPPAVRTPMIDGVIRDGQSAAAVERSRPLSPGQVIDAIEKSLRRRRAKIWVFPGPAGIVWRVRRLAPGLVNAATTRLGG